MPGLIRNSALYFLVVFNIIFWLIILAITINP